MLKVNDFEGNFSIPLILVVIYEMWNLSYEMCASDINFISTAYIWLMGYRNQLVEIIEKGT